MALWSKIYLLPFKNFWGGKNSNFTNVHFLIPTTRFLFAVRYSQFSLLLFQHNQLELESIVRAGIRPLPEAVYWSTWLFCGCYPPSCTRMTSVTPLLPFRVSHPLKETWEKAKTSSWTTAVTNGGIGRKEGAPKAGTCSWSPVNFQGYLKSNPCYFLPLPHK